MHDQAVPAAPRIIGQRAVSGPFLTTPSTTLTFCALNPMAAVISKIDRMNVFFMGTKLMTKSIVFAPFFFRYRFLQVIKQDILLIFKLLG